MAIQGFFSQFRNLNLVSGFGFDRRGVWNRVLHICLPTREQHVADLFVRARNHYHLVHPHRLHVRVHRGRVHFEPRLALIDGNFAGHGVGVTFACGGFSPDLHGG